MSIGSEFFCTLEEVYEIYFEGARTFEDQELRNVGGWIKYHKLWWKFSTSQFQCGEAKQVPYRPAWTVDILKALPGLNLFQWVLTHFSAWTPPVCGSWGGQTLHHVILLIRLRQYHNSTKNATYLMSTIMSKIITTCLS